MIRKQEHQKLNHYWRNELQMLLETFFISLECLVLYMIENEISSPKAETSNHHSCLQGNIYILNHQYEGGLSQLCTMTILP